MLTTKTLRWGLLSLCVCTFFLYGEPANAQLDTSFLDQRPEISFSPQFPSPGEEVKVTLSTNTFNPIGASITWIIDGADTPALKNQLTFTLTAKESGEHTTVGAFISSGLDVFAVENTLTPNEMDIIVEAETIVPSFYKGRPLPGAGSTVYVSAIPGGDVPPASLFYSWRIGNETLYGGPVRGKQRAAFVLENGRKKVVRLSVTKENGVVVGEKLIVINDTRTLTRFYKENLLRGTETIAVENTLFLDEEEVGVQAIPYFMSSDIQEDEAGFYEWRLNNRLVENAGNDPFSIALRKSGSGKASLDFAVRNKNDLMQKTSGRIGIEFE